jgi:hypothetical protein
VPQAIPLIVAQVVGAVTASTVIATVVQMGLQLLLTKALAKKPNAGAFPLNVTVRSTVSARRLVFGTVRAAGAMVFVRTSGNEGKYLWYVIAYAGHQCHAMKDLYLDKFKIAAADINGTTGAVSTAVFDGKLKCWDHLGTSAQTVDTNLDGEFTEWTSNHRLRGICYSVLRFERSDKAFPTGAPESCTRVIDGALLYDPRQDSTNGGAGAQRASNPSTWSFTSGGHNPALALRWFLSGGSVINDLTTRHIMYGLKEADSRIDDSYTIAAANLCDQSLGGGNAPPSGAQPRYTLNIEFSCDQTRREIIEEILAVMGGVPLVGLHGSWRTYAAEYTSPSHTFTELDLFGTSGMSIEDTTGDEDRKNQVSAIFTDASKDYTQQSSAVRTNAAYITQDGGQNLFEEIDLRGVTDQYEAQRTAELYLRRNRQMRRVRIPFGRQGLKIAPWETFTFSHSKFGWVNKVYRCITAREIEYTEGGGMICWITAQIEDSSIYTDLVTADYTTGTSNTNALQSDKPEAPTGLVAIPGILNIEFNWAIGQFWERNGIVKIYRHTASTPFSSAVEVWSGRGTRAVVQFNNSTLGYFWVRLETIHAQMSDTEPASTGLAAAPLRDPRIITDPNFDWSADQSRWQFNNDLFTTGTPTNISLVSTGGVSAGVLRLVGDTSAKWAFNKRSEEYVVVTGQTIKIRFRWRRTSSLTSAAGADNVLSLQVFTHTGGIPVGVGFTSCGSRSFDRTTVNAVNVNEWQEAEQSFAIANAIKSSTQHPYLSIAIGMTALCTGGTLEIDHLEAHLV